MKQVISTEGVPIKMWLDDIEDGAVSQAKNLANLPFVHKHIAIMPDSHQGFGMPIGGVMATKGVVIPNARHGNKRCSYSKCSWSRYWMWYVCYKNTIL
jgi:tRNA-splicing ligase RtcB